MLHVLATLLKVWGVSITLKCLKCWHDREMFEMLQVLAWVWSVEVIAKLWICETHMKLFRQLDLRDRRHFEDRRHSAIHGFEFQLHILTQVTFPVVMTSSEDVVDFHSLHTGVRNSFHQSLFPLQHDLREVDENLARPDGPTRNQPWCGANVPSRCGSRVFNGFEQQCARHLLVCPLLSS